MLLPPEPNRRFSRRRTPRFVIDDNPSTEHRWYLSRAPIDAQGRWELTDVLPGVYTVELRDDPGARSGD